MGSLDGSDRTGDLVHLEGVEEVIVLSDELVFELVTFLRELEIHDADEYTGKCLIGCDACRAKVLITRMEKECGPLPMEMLGIRGEE